MSPAGSPYVAVKRSPAVKRDVSSADPCGERRSVRMTARTDRSSGAPLALVPKSTRADPFSSIHGTWFHERFGLPLPTWTKCVNLAYFLRAATRCLRHHNAYRLHFCKLHAGASSAEKKYRTLAKSAPDEPRRSKKLQLQYSNAENTTVFHSSYEHK